MSLFLALTRASPNTGGSCAVRVVAWALTPLGAWVLAALGARFVVMAVARAAVFPASSRWVRGDMEREVRAPHAAACRPCVRTALVTSVECG